MTEQERREKVIKHIIDCVNSADGLTNVQWVLAELDILKDALVLLKAQEPVKPTWRLDYAYCGKCGFHLHWMVEKNNYCPECGRAVKW